MRKYQLEDSIRRAIERTREERPLVGSITNAITMDFVANAQLACGGSAAIVYMAEEGKAMAEASDSMYMNLGGLLPLHQESIVQTAFACKDAGTPWVLDPVGIGIGSIRNTILSQLVDARPSIIKGNASEVISLCQMWASNPQDASSAIDGPKGVDSTSSVGAALPFANELANRTGAVVVVTGKNDLVTDGAVGYHCFGGSPLMAYITGAGCSLGGVLATYLAAADPMTAALAGVCSYNVAATKAESMCNGPASFKVAFLDTLYSQTPDDVSYCKIERIESDSD